MNDRYLYRAKRMVNREWITGCILHDSRLEKYRIVTGVGYSNGMCVENSIAPIVDPLTICQCTGQKDKHGKLIYENDILVAHLDDEFPDNETYMQVIWKNSGLFLKHSGCDFCEQLDEFIEKHFEVIGNIFDNAELLEVGE